MESSNPDSIDIEKYSAKMDYVIWDSWVDLDANERMIEFELNHFQKFNRFANANFQDTFEKYANALKNHGEAVEETLAEIEDKTKEIIPYDQIAKAMGQEAAGLMLTNQFNLYLAREVVANSVKGGVDYIGRRGAVVVVDKTFKLTATQAAAGTVKNMGFVSALPGIGATIGQNLAELAIDAAGIDNPHAKNAAKLGGAVAGGAATGAAIGAMGGPAGVAAGAIAGAATYATGEAIQGILNSGFWKAGIDNNHVYMECGDLKGLEIWAGTYKDNDTMYFHTYWKEYRKAPDHFILSAGQEQNESFQLTVWFGSSTMKHFNKVYYGDFIRVFWVGEHIKITMPESLKGGKSKKAKRLRAIWKKKRDGKVLTALAKFKILHAKGRYWGDEAGTVDVYSWNR